MFWLMRHRAVWLGTPALASPKVRTPLEVVLDKQPLHLNERSGPEPIYDPEAILALIYTSGTTGSRRASR